MKPNEVQVWKICVDQFRAHLFTGSQSRARSFCTIRTFAVEMWLWVKNRTDEQNALFIVKKSAVEA